MGFGNEITSGKFTIYAQWSAIIALLRIVNFIHIIPFAIIGFVGAFFLVWLEIPLLTRCCPGGPRMDRFTKIFSNTLFRSMLYAAFSVVLWLSILMKSTSFLAAAVFMSISAVFYLVSVGRGEDLERSSITGPRAAVGAASQV
ncbi:hypothetical protein BC832DRAFT_327795 [Gaertneriomyces semiglobifer]|nr:hypothetical protein BC832DRAFT_327795 [Gaertneriomyces semiglobifer]